MKTKKDRLTWRGMAAAAALLALAVAALWMRGGGRGPRPRENGRPLENENAARPHGAGPRPANVTQRGAGMTPPGGDARDERPAPTNAPAEAASTARAEAPAFAKRPGALQLPDGRVLTFPPPKEGEVRKVYAHGRLYECDHEGNFTEVTKRQLFRTAFEANFLGLAVADKPFIPAFLTGLDEADVRAALTKPYEPKGDETEEELAQLKAYDEMRGIALEYMDGGGSFDDFVEAFAKQVKEERAANAACLREVMTLYKQGRLAEARAAAESADALKRENGLDPLRLPPHVRERLGLGPGSVK